MSSRRIAIITNDVLSETMAGPAIRAFNMAQALANDGHQVVLISTVKCTLSLGNFRCDYADWGDLREAVGDADVVICQGFVTYHAPWLLRSDKILVVDLYDPMHFEQLEQTATLSKLERATANDLTTRVLNEQLVRGDFFLCASEEQRHLWLGQLAAMGRVNPANYDRDSSLDSLITVCPFGMPAEPPKRTGSGIRVVPGIGAEDKVLIWAGGVYNWFDPLTLIKAVHLVSRKHADLRLFFLGMQHPNPDVPEMEMAYRARQLSDSLGLTDKHVFFNEGWVPYEERANFLLDADAGVSTHPRHVETAFSFRTRILDYLWAGLPILSTGGDTFGELVGRAGLGVRVEPNDVDGLADGIAGLLYDRQKMSAASAAVNEVRQRFTWDVVLRPLIEFCAAPERAADTGADQRRFVRSSVPPKTRIGRKWQRILTLLRVGGPTLVVQRVWAKVRS